MDDSNFLSNGHGRVGREGEREREREREGHAAHQRGEPGQTPVRSPLKQKIVHFFITDSDLPCKRTCHGKGLMTKNIRNKDQNLTSLDYIKAFISDEI